MEAYVARAGSVQEGSVDRPGRPHAHTTREADGDSALPRDAISDTLSACTLLCGCQSGIEPADLKR